jgi:hypothetical protein
MCEDEIEDASIDQKAPRSFEHGHCIGGKLAAVFRICDILIRDPWIRILDYGSGSWIRTLDYGSETLDPYSGLRIRIRILLFLSLTVAFKVPTNMSFSLLFLPSDFKIPCNCIIFFRNKTVFFRFLRHHLEGTPLCSEQFRLVLSLNRKRIRASGLFISN